MYRELQSSWVLALQSQHLHLRNRFPPGQGGRQQFAGLSRRDLRTVDGDARRRARHSPGFATPATCPWMRTAAPTPAFRSFSPTGSSARRRSSTASTPRIPATTASTKDRFVVARNTRYGQVRAFGNGSSELIPLPERLYAGGPVSLRGFSQNAAGPRDPETGYQIGGAGALDQQHGDAPAAAHAALARQYGQLCDLSRYGQRVYQCRRCVGQRPARAPARQRRVPELRWPTRNDHNLLQIHPFPHTVPTPQPASKARAASTTSLMRWAPVCATIRRSGPSGSISAIT